jgi:hypothetical protein
MQHQATSGKDPRVKPQILLPHFQRKGNIVQVERAGTESLVQPIVEGGTPLCDAVESIFDSRAEVIHQPIPSSRPVLSIRCIGDATVQRGFNTIYEDGSSPALPFFVRPTDADKLLVECPGQR